jgi:hypothetical protein
MSATESATTSRVMDESLFETRRAEVAEARVAALESALAACLRFAPGGIDDVTERHDGAVQAWVDAWNLIEGTSSDWRRSRAKRAPSAIEHRSET